LEITIQLKEGGLIMGFVYCPNCGKGMSEESARTDCINCGHPFNASIWRMTISSVAK